MVGLSISKKGMIVVFLMNYLDFGCIVVGVSGLILWVI